MNPESEQTNVGGKAKSVFTASRRGVAVIKAKAGNVIDKIIVAII